MASRCRALHRFVPSALRVHEVANTITIPYIATTPNVTATGRKLLCIGTNTSSGWNFMYVSSNRPPRCTPSRSRATVAAN